MNTLKIQVCSLFACFGIWSNVSAQEWIAANSGDQTFDHNLTVKEEKNAHSEKTTDAKVKAIRYRWEFGSAIPDEFDESVKQNAEKDEFGQRIACLKALVDKYYVHREALVPGDPTMRTIIRKPVVYNTARKIEKHLRKEVKKGRRDRQKAVDELNYVLEVAIAVVSEKDTDGFEASLSNDNNVDQQIMLFKQVKINNLK